LTDVRQSPVNIKFFAIGRASVRRPEPIRPWPVQKRLSH
jgi:hypothetical protein